MRRLAVLAAVLLAAPVALVAILGARAQGSSTVRFDVIFDDARGLIGGQLVKVAGAKAGTIVNVVVTPDFKARVEATIDSRFAPLRQNATCTIRPEGLIAENYIDCDPGTMSSPPLRAQGSEPPTVPVTRTTEPVSLLDLFNIFNLPTRQRFTAVIDELGIGTAGRGDDFNDILRRANPALAEARQVIGILDRQRANLATAVDATSTILNQLAGHTGSVQQFLDRSAALTTLTAAHSGNLSLGIARLPGLLAAAQPSLAELDTVAREGTPLAAELRVAAPALVKVQHDLGPFTAVAKPGLADLTRALRRAIPALHDATPLTQTLSSYAARSLPSTELFARLSSNLQRHGVIENLQSVFYGVGTSLARFDATSHLLSILLVGPQNGVCSVYATTPVAGCSAHFGSQPAFIPSRRAARTAGRSAGPGGPTVAATPAPANGAAPAPRTDRSGASSGSAAPAPPNAAGGALQQTVGDLQSLVNYLLH